MSDTIRQTHAHHVLNKHAGPILTGADDHGQHRPEHEQPVGLGVPKEVVMGAGGKDGEEVGDGDGHVKQRDDLHRGRECKFILYDIQRWPCTEA